MVKGQRSGLHLVSSDCIVIFYIVFQEVGSRDRRLLPRGNGVFFVLYRRTLQLCHAGERLSHRRLAETSVN